MFYRGISCVEPARHRYHTFFVRPSFVIHIILAGAILSYSEIRKGAHDRLPLPAPSLLLTILVVRKHDLLIVHGSFFYNPFPGRFVPCHFRDTYLCILDVYGIIERRTGGPVRARSFSPQIPPLEYASLISLRETCRLFFRWWHSSNRGVLSPACIQEVFMRHRISALGRTARRIGADRNCPEKPVLENTGKQKLNSRYCSSSMAATRTPSLTSSPRVARRRFSIREIQADDLYPFL